jgi:hypothetical protein
LNAKPPRFVNDVYRDLRDRRLLLPALVLIIALIAVPIVLRKPAEPVAAPPVAAPTSDTSAVTSAVLVDSSVDVRNYKKRLAKLKSKNPFTQHFGIATGGGTGGSADTSTSTGSTSTSTGSTSTDTSSTTPPASGGGSTSTDVSSGTPTATTPDTTTPSAPTQPTQPEIRFFAGRVDVTVGPIGKGKDLDNVKYLTFLPDDSAPIAAFVGLTGSGRSESAVFAITSQSAVLDGDGTCAPHKPDPCQFLTLKPGEQRYIRYNDKTYRLKVRDTHIVEVKDPSADSNQDNNSGDGSSGNGNSGSQDGNADTGGTQPRG